MDENTPVDPAAAPDADAVPDAQVTANTDDAAASPDSEPEPVVADVVCTIERRSFARASADEPMPVTTITGN